MLVTHDLIAPIVLTNRSQVCKSHIYYYTFAMPNCLQLLYCIAIFLPSLKLFRKLTTKLSIPTLYYTDIIKTAVLKNLMCIVCLEKCYVYVLASYPGRGRMGKKRPGTNCTCMRQHLRDIYRKIVRIPLMKHVVMPRKENTDEIYSRQELQAKKNAAADRYHR